MQTLTLTTAPLGTITHQAFFWLNNPHSTADRDELIAGLQTLTRIPEIRHLQIDIPASTEQRDVVDASFAVLELMLFDNLEDQKVYQDHPLHQAFIARCAHLWARVVVYDSVAA
jgi:hypothetical protein